MTAISPGMVETEFAAVAAFGDAQTAAAKYREFRCLQVTRAPGRAPACLCKAFRP